MQSMTGYGRGEAEADGLTVAVEVTAVNRKGLEVVVQLPKGWQTLEPTIQEQVKAGFSRGRINLAVKVEHRGASDGVDWQESEIKSELERYRKLAEHCGVGFEPDAHFLFKLVESLQERGGGDPEPAVIALLEKALGEALQGLREMRATEGAALAIDLRERLGRIGSSVEALEKRALETVPNYRTVLLERLQKAGLELELGDERVLKELAIFADRVDVSEELTRLRAHVEQFLVILGEDGPVGRKMDFLCQELFREVNTVGSKANSLAMTTRVIEIKQELERIREQVQNIE